MSKLSDLLNSGTVTARQAADRAQKAGIDLRYGTIAAYWSGGHGRPTAKTLSKLAKVVPFTEKRLQEAAWDTSAPLGPYVAPEEAVLLSERQRRALDELIRSIVATRGQHHVLEATQEPGTSGAPNEDQKTSIDDAQLDRMSGDILGAGDDLNRRLLEESAGADGAEYGEGDAG